MEWRKLCPPGAIPYEVVGMRRDGDLIVVSAAFPHQRPTVVFELYSRPDKPRHMQRTNLSRAGAMLATFVSEEKHISPMFYVPPKDGSNKRDRLMKCAFGRSNIDGKTGFIHDRAIFTADILFTKRAWKLYREANQTEVRERSDWAMELRKSVLQTFGIVDAPGLISHTGAK